MTIVIESFGLLTPETTQERGRRLYVAWDKLYRDANDSQKKRITNDYNGYLQYYGSLVNSLVARLTEYGELEAWEKRYQGWLDTFTKEGLSTSAPTIVGGKAPGTSVDVNIPQAKEASEKAKEGMEELKRALYVLGGIGAAFLLWKLLKKK